MSIQSLDIDPGSYGTQITVARASGRNLDDQGGVLSSRCWGIHTSNGLPYFDPLSPDPGELAPLAYDAAKGTFYLAAGEAPDSPHMMLARGLRARALSHVATSLPPAGLSQLIGAVAPAATHPHLTAVSQLAQRAQARARRARPPVTAPPSRAFSAAQAARAQVRATVSIPDPQAHETARAARAAVWQRHTPRRQEIR